MEVDREYQSRSESMNVEGFIEDDSPVEVRKHERTTRQNKRRSGPVED